MNGMATNPTQMCVKSELEVYQSLSPFYDRMPAGNYLGERGISAISFQLLHFSYFISAIAESLLSLPAGKGGQLEQVVAVAIGQGSSWLPHSASQRPDCSARRLGYIPQGLHPMAHATHLLKFPQPPKTVP